MLSLVIFFCLSLAHTPPGQGGFNSEQETHVQCVDVQLFITHTGRFRLTVWATNVSVIHTTAHLSPHPWAVERELERIVAVIRIFRLSSQSSWFTGSSGSLVEFCSLAPFPPSSAFSPPFLSFPSFLHSCDPSFSLS